LIKNYSILIKPISIVAHLIILNGVFYLGGFEDFDKNNFLLFFNLSWLLVSYYTGMYHYHRTITVTKVVQQLFTQIAVFSLVFFSYYTVTHQNIDIIVAARLLLYSFIGVVLFRAFYFYSLRKYRIGGGNFRKVILLGSGKGMQPLADFMVNRADFGYKIMGYFTDDSSQPFTCKNTEKALINNKNEHLEYLGTIENYERYVLENHIDEIYCSLSELKEKTLANIINFGDEHLKIVKLIPDNKDLITKNLSLEYYGFVPVFSIRNLPLDKSIFRFSKRVFDIVFSILVLVFILSWLIPILYILIKIESKGDLFFLQKREGINGESFECYKFRSMSENDRSEKDQTVKNDVRITKVGKFIRKTSIDELPQFINVLKGEMSVVGPRPHMLSQSKIFKKIVDKYTVRHFVKPGITGLAQVRGFRGEIESDRDIINRVKLDLFYVENWSFVMDINIILKTIFNVIMGEKKAY